MSGTPPFCTLGSKYLTDDLSNATRTFTQTTADIDTTFGVFGTKFTITKGQATEEYEIPLGFTWNTHTEHTVSIDYSFFLPSGRYGTVYYGGKDTPSTAQSNNEIWLVYTGTQIYLSVYGIGGASTSGYFYAPASGNVRVEFKNALRAYVNGVLKIEELNNTLSGTNNITKLLIGCFANTGAAYPGMNYGIISNLIIESPDMPNPCQGEIPTFHKEINSSTAKISHSRILREDRNATQALRFHSQMKETT